MQNILDFLDVIEWYEHEGQKLTTMRSQPRKLNFTYALTSTPQTRYNLWELSFSIRPTIFGVTAKSMGLTYLLISHDPDVVRWFSDQVFIFKNRVLQTG
jgi:hypothetical protein